MNLEQFRELVMEIDQIMTKCRHMLPDKYIGEKNKAFERLREAVHWIRDIYETGALEAENEKNKLIIEERMKNGQPTTPA